MIIFFISGFLLVVSQRYGTLIQHESRQRFVGVNGRKVVVNVGVKCYCLQFLILFYIKFSACFDTFPIKRGSICDVWQTEPLCSGPLITTGLYLYYIRMAGPTRSFYTFIIIGAWCVGCDFHSPPSSFMQTGFLRWMVFGVSVSMPVRASRS